ncbi:MAG: ribbon-helix-helix domain-containing protein [Candidatus Pacebacteria bacterium]|nr:ribbon-helix-helix domain-containing protein [Candidatus Paceibacterota bacterium]
MRQIINISLSKELDAAVEWIVKRGRYSTKSEFLRELIRERIAEEDLLVRIRKSEAEFRSGKGKILRSLRDLS